MFSQTLLSNTLSIFSFSILNLSFSSSYFLIIPIVLYIRLLKSLHSSVLYFNIKLSADITPSCVYGISLNNIYLSTSKPNVFTISSGYTTFPTDLLIFPSLRINQLCA